MIRSLLRTFSRFLTAVVLFALMLCAVEVWFRWERLNTQIEQQQAAPSLKDLVLPDSTSWIRVAQLIDLEMPIGVNEQTRLRTNEFGTRGGEITLPKPGGVFRVLCLGGSGIFGLGQKEEETVPAQLQALFRETGLSHVEFINAGCPGSGPLTNYLRLRTQLIALQPDLVLFCILPEEILLDTEVRGGLVLDQQGLPAFATHPALSGKTSDELNLVCQEFASADWFVNQLGPFLGLTTTSRTTHHVDVNEPRSLKALAEMWQFTQAFHCRFMISIVPNGLTVEPQPGAESSRNADSLEHDLHTFFADRGVQSTSLVHNPIQIFQQNAEQQPVFQEGRGHLTPLGNMLYARTIAKSMVDFVPSILQPSSPASAPESPELLSPLNTGSPRLFPDPTNTAPIGQQPTETESIIQ